MYYEKMYREKNIFCIFLFKITKYDLKEIMCLYFLHIYQGYNWVLK